MIRTRLMASSRAFLSSVRFALLTLTTSRLWVDVGGMGNLERGGGVAVESEGESTAGAGLVPLAAFLPRAMLYGEENKGRGEREEERNEEKRRRVTWLTVPFSSSNQFAPCGPSNHKSTSLLSYAQLIPVPQ